MKQLKKIFLLLLLIIGVGSVKAERTFDTTIKIYDYAQILSEKEEKKLKKNAEKYIEKNNIDMVIVAVKHYKQKKLEEYMELFYNKNNFGIGQNKSGIMFTIDLKKDNIGLKTFGLAKDLYSEEEIQKILSKVNKENNYEDKINTVIKYSNKYINEFGNTGFEDNIIFSINWIGIIVISFVLSTIIIFIGLLNSRKKVTKKQFDECIKSLIITTKKDSFITTKTQKRRKGKKNN